MIVKRPNDRKKKKTGGYRWCLCTDGSDKSIKSFEKMAALYQEGDSCVFLHVNDNKMKKEDILKVFGPFLEKYKVSQKSNLQD